MTPFAISKECMWKYDQKSYANIVTIPMYLGNTVSRNVVQYYAIIGCDATSFFYINRKINPSQEVLKNQSV